MSGSSKTFTVALLCIAILAILASAPIASMAPGGNNSANNTITATPTVTPTALPSPGPSITATPTPGPLFSNAVWNSDHVTVTVNNNKGEQIQVTAYINDQSNNKKYIVDPGVTETLDTPSVSAENGQILKFGFIAYLNGTKLDSDSLETTVTVIKGATATPAPQETASLTGTILDSSNQTPIVGAQVIFSSMTGGSKEYTSVTGSDGTFTTPKMYPDSYQITIKASGYQTGFGSVQKFDGAKILDPIALTAIPRPTVTVTPTPTPSPSPLDPWIALLYNPTVCVGTISSLIAVILGSIGIYDWMMKQRAARRKSEKEEADKAKAAESKPTEGKDNITGSKPPEGDKK